MSTRKEVNQLVKDHFPGVPVIGKGVTLDSLRQKLVVGGIIDSNYKPIAKQTSPVLRKKSPRTKNRSPIRLSPKKDKKSLFPYGPGFELIDMNILANMPDSALASVCRTNSYVAKLCNDNEFWRQKLSVALKFKVYLKNKNVNYKHAYEQYIGARDHPEVLWEIALGLCHYEIFVHFIELPEIRKDKIIYMLNKSLFCENNRVMVYILNNMDVTESDATHSLRNALYARNNRRLNSIDVALHLIENKIDHPQASLLEAAIHYGDRTLFEALVEKDRKNANLLINGIETRFCVATSSQKLEMVKHVVENWPKSYSNYYPDLLCSVVGENTDITEYLVGKIDKWQFETLDKPTVAELLREAGNNQSIPHLIYFLQKGIKATKPDLKWIRYIVAGYGTLKDFLYVLNWKTPNYITTEKIYGELFLQTIRNNKPDTAKYLLENAHIHVETTDKDKFRKKLVYDNLDIAVGMAEYEIIQEMGKYIDLAKQENVFNFVIKAAIDAGDADPKVENYLKIVELFILKGVRPPAIIKKICNVLQKVDQS
jgi:hypothetical protein